jgi:hypothetical protein
MAVDVYPNNILSTGGSGAAPITQVSESYSASTNDALYIVKRGQGNPATTDKVLMAINTVALRTEYSRNGGTGNSVSNTAFIRNELINPVVRGANQFAQATIAMAWALSYDGGIAVMLQGDQAIDQGIQNGGNGYMLTPNPAGAFPQPLRLRRASISENVVSSIATNVNIGDILRLEIRAITAGTQWELKTFVNTVLVDTFVENIGGITPLTSYGGYPGMFIGNIPTPNGTVYGYSAQSWGKL